MKRNILILLLLLSGHCLGYAQQLISGTVTDGRHPIVGANVFVKGTTDGCLTDSLGHFSFSTLKADSTQLMVTCIGYDNAERNWQKGLGPLAIRLYERTTTIDEVVVTGSTFRFGQANGVKQLGALDVVLDGGSCGDIVAALQSLPGTQKVGEDGKLYILILYLQKNKSNFMKFLKSFLRPLYLPVEGKHVSIMFIMLSMMSAIVVFVAYSTKSFLMAFLVCVLLSIIEVIIYCLLNN